jgi:heme exporter protein D
VSGRTYTVKVHQYGRFKWHAFAQSPTSMYWWTSANGRTRRQVIRRVKRKLRKHEREMAWQADEEQIEVTP